MENSFCSGVSVCVLSIAVTSTNTRWYDINFAVIVPHFYMVHIFFRLLFTTCQAENLGAYSKILRYFFVRCFHCCRCCSDIHRFIILGSVAAELYSIYQLYCGWFGLHTVSSVALMSLSYKSLSLYISLSLSPSFLFSVSLRCFWQL